MSFCTKLYQFLRFIGLTFHWKKKKNFALLTQFFLKSFQFFFFLRQVFADTSNKNCCLKKIFVLEKYKQEQTTNKPEINGEKKKTIKKVNK